MKKEDFKEATPKHIKIAKKIVKNGSCNGISCNSDNCPFYYNTWRYEFGNVDCESDSVSLAKKFLELFDTEPKALNFYERLSATLYGKQVLFKQDNGIYYNKNIHDTMTKSEVKEWLLAEVAEVCKDD